MVEVGSWVTSTNLHTLHRAPPSLTVAILLPMPDLLAARSQMAVSLAFHIVFAVIGIAMPLMMVLAERRWQVTGHAIYLDLAKRWAKGTAILFAVGAVSGTVLSFELGLLWPRFMAFAGAIIGMPFSLEGFAFFTEAIFLGIYLYGWDRISSRAHLWAAVLQPISGDLSARHIAVHQPVKLAAAEALFRTQTGAPLTLGGWPDAAARETRFAVHVPYVLSLLAFHDPHAVVKGLDQVPVSEWPNVRAVHLSFDVMVAAGTYLALVALWTGWLAWRRADLAHNRRLMRPLALATPLGFLAVEAGWMVTELGRQPWVIYGGLKTADAVTPMPGLMVPVLTFLLLYCFLGVIVAWLLYRHIIRSPAVPEWREFYMPGGGTRETGKETA